MVSIPSIHLTVDLALCGILLQILATMLMQFQEVTVEDLEVNRAHNNHLNSFPLNNLRHLNSPPSNLHNHSNSLSGLLLHNSLVSNNLANSLVNNNLANSLVRNNLANSLVSKNLANSLTNSNWGRQ